MIYRDILVLFIFGLLVWLLIDNVLQIDLASTKNNQLIQSEKIKVDNFQKIDSLKIYTKSKLDVINQNTKNNSEIATKRIWIIIGGILLQVILLFVVKKNK